MSYRELQERARQQRQTQFLTLTEVRQYLKPWSDKDFWNILKKHPKFPAPVRGGPGSKQIYTKDSIDQFVVDFADEQGGGE